MTALIRVSTVVLCRAAQTCKQPKGPSRADGMKCKCPILVRTGDCAEATRKDGPLGFPYVFPGPRGPFAGDVCDSVVLQKVAERNLIQFCKRFTDVGGAVLGRGAVIVLVTENSSGSGAEMCAFL